MLFKLTDECFAHSTNSSDLLGLSQSVLRGCHGITVSDEDAVHYGSWLDRQTLETREEWELAISETARRQAMGPSAREAEVVHSAASNFDSVPFEISPREAVTFSRSPFRIFVENDNADKNFLLAFSNSFQAKELASLEDEDFIVFEHCGGITHLPSRLEARLARNARFKHMVAAVYDSDSLEPNVRSSQADRVHQSCVKAGVPSYCLERRSIENYLPLWALTSWANINRNRADRAKLVQAKNALAGLLASQHHHFNMKNGLNGDGPRLSDAVWGGLNRESRLALEQGFGQDVASMFDEDWVRDKVSQRDSGWEEINQVIVSILELVR